MFTQTQYKGLNTKQMEKDFKRLTKQYLKLGKNQEQAEDQAKQMVEYYIHQYRVFA